MAIEGVTTIEIPEPNYPIPKLLKDDLPRDVLLNITGGKEPEKYRQQLLREDEKYTKKKIKQTGKSYDIIFDLHDNTPHPDEWKYKKPLVEEEGGYMNKDGYMVSPLAAQIYVFYDVNRRLEQLTKSFRPKIYPKIPFEVEQRRTLSHNTIGLEYLPARLDKWTKEVHKLPVTKGLQFLTRLIYHMKDNYV